MVGPEPIDAMTRNWEREKLDNEIAAVARRHAEKPGICRSPPTAAEIKRLKRILHEYHEAGVLARDMVVFVAAGQKVMKDYTKWQSAILFTSLAAIQDPQIGSDFLGLASAREIVSTYCRGRAGAGAIRAVMPAVHMLEAASR